MSDYTYYLAIALVLFAWAVSIYFAVKAEDERIKEALEINKDYAEFLKTGNDIPSKLREGEKA